MSTSTESEQTFKRFGLLDSIKILICRPEPSASELSHALEAMGANCHKLPMLRIDPIKIEPAERQHILDLDQYQHVIVVSQHAAEMGIELIDEYWPQPPISQTWYAIGRKTSEALNSESFDITPTQQDLSSEELLANQSLQAVKGDKVLILKGKQGRDTIEKTLQARGALVDTVSFYRRSRPEYSSADLQKHIEDFVPDYIIALSGETLSNLIAYCHDYNIDLSERSFILSSNRVANIAYENGFKTVLVPENLMPMDIVKAIKNSQRQKRQ